MRHHSMIRNILIAFLLTSLIACDEKEEFTTENINDFVSLAPGKYITYRIDSTVFTSFGTRIEIHRYQVKDQVDAMITDNLGRPSYRVFRYMRDSLGLNAWQPTGSFMVTPLSDQIEVIEDNFRFIKLHMPMRNGFTWKGNRYLPTEPYYPTYTFNNDGTMQDWDFYYDGEAASFSYRGNTYNDVYTIEQQDDNTNIPITNPTLYASRSRALEKYAKNIGLVYREYELWDYQPVTPGTGGPSYNGFGIKKWMIDHN